MLQNIKEGWRYFASIWTEGRAVVKALRNLYLTPKVIKTRFPIRSLLEIPTYYMQDINASVRK